MTYIFVDLGRSWSFFMGFGEQRQNTFREPRQLFSGILGDQCIIFRDQGSTDPPGGPRESSPEKTDFDYMRKAKVQISLHICIKWFAAILLVSLTTFQIEFESRPVCALYVSKPFNFLPWVAKKPIAPHVCLRKSSTQRSNIYESVMIFSISI